MAKIREDLEGVVSVDGHVLYAGDEVPDGVEVGEHVLEPKSDPVKVENTSGDDKPKRGRRSGNTEGE